MQNTIKVLWAIVMYVTMANNLGAQENAQLDSLMLMGKNLEESQDFVGALAIYQQCTTTDTTSMEAKFRLGKIAYKLGDFKAAKMSLEGAMLDSNDMNRAYRILAPLYDQEQNVPKAIKYYSALSQMNPQNAFYQRCLGRLYNESSLYQEAFNHYAEAHSINNRDMLAAAGLAQILIKNRQYVMADSIMEHCLAYDSLNVAINLQYASSKYRQKAYHTTCSILNRMQHRIDFNQYYGKMYGFSLLQIDSIEKSIFFLERSLTRPGNPEKAHYYLGLAYEKSENPEFAEYHFKKAIEAGISTDINLYYKELAQMADEENDMKAEINYLKKSLEFNDDHLVLYKLARVSDEYYKDKRIALRYYEKYIKHPKATDYYLEYIESRVKRLKEELHQNKER